MNFLSSKKFSLTFFMTLMIFQGSLAALQWQEKLSPWQQFNIEGNDRSFLLSFEIQKGDKVFLADLISPLGEKLVVNNVGRNSSRVPPFLYTTMRSNLRPELVLPNIFAVSSAKLHSLTPGVWKYRLAQNSQHAIVNIDIQKALLLQSPSMMLDIYIEDYFSKRPKLRESIEQSIVQMSELYQTIGINLDISVIDSWKDPMLATNDLMKKVQNYSQINRSHQSIFITPRINASIQKDFQGLAACLPFAISSRLSCPLVVAIGDHSKEISKNRLGKVLSHELAHGLGLFHLTDDFYPFTMLNDGLEDTSLNDDINNVMHKTSQVEALPEFSPMQIEWMLRQPILYKR